MQRLMIPRWLPRLDLDHCSCLIHATTSRLIVCGWRPSHWTICSRLLETRFFGTWEECKACKCDIGKGVLVSVCKLINTGGGHALTRKERSGRGISKNSTPFLCSRTARGLVINKRKIGKSYLALVAPLGVLVASRLILLQFCFIRFILEQLRWRNHGRLSSPLVKKGGGGKKT